MKITRDSIAAFAKGIGVAISMFLISACSCNSVFFYPQSQLLLTPDDGGIDYEVVNITTNDGIVLHNWLLKPKSTVKGRILFLHGNAENISTHVRNVYWLPEFGYEVLLIDYRGYGKSQGEPCLPAIIEDVRASFQWLEERNNSELPLFVMGQSLGASLAAYSVGIHPEWHIQGLVLDAPFDSYREIARDKLGSVWLTWALQHPLSWLFSDQFSPIEVIAGISPRPLLVFASVNDRIVPIDHSQKLFEKAGKPKSLITTDGSHIATFSKNIHRQQLVTFLTSPKKKRKLDKITYCANVDCSKLADKGMYQ